MKKNLSIFSLILIVLGILWLSWKLINISPKQSHIQNQIKIANGIQETSMSFPTVSKPSSSLIGILGNDSVRVMIPKTINVLWQDASRWDSITAKKIAKINPDKFIINIDGPGSLHTKTTGPHPTELVGFIKSLTKTYGWNGTLVMHPDCNKSEFVHDWVGSNAKDTLWTSTSYQLYADYFLLLNDTLKLNGLRTFTELLIETEGSGMTSKANVQNKIFDNFRNHIKDSSITLSATSDWGKKSFPDSADYYYAQMYDMCYIDTTSTILCGHNYPSSSRIKELVKEMKKTITLDSLNKISFIFTYAPEPKPTKKNPHPKPGADAPMFGENSTNYWNKSQFMAFSKSFKTSIGDVSVGIWHCEGPLSNW